jgi:hypothetical protein
MKPSKSRNTQFPDALIKISQARRAKPFVGARHAVPLPYAAMIEDKAQRRRWTFHEAVTVNPYTAQEQQ